MKIKKSKFNKRASTRHVDYLSLRKRSGTDALIASVPDPPGAIPLHGPPLWKTLPLGAKLTAPQCMPTGMIEMCRSKVGNDLWRTTEKLGFSLYDPNGYEFRFEYEPLHDPNLRHYFQSNVCTVQRLQSMGFVSPSYGAVCSLKQYNDYRKFLNRVHQYYVEKERRRLADETLLANQLLNAEENYRKDRERLAKQVNIQAMRDLKKHSALQELKERKRRESERERRLQLAAERLEHRALTQKANAMEAAKLHGLKTARMQLLANEIQRQRQVDNKLRWQEKQRRFEERRKNKIKSMEDMKKFKCDILWEMLTDRQTKELDRKEKLLAKQKAIFDFNVKLRKAIVDDERKRFAKQFEKYRRKTCICEKPKQKKKKKPKSKKRSSKKDSEGEETGEETEEEDEGEGGDAGGEDDDDGEDNEDEGEDDPKKDGTKELEEVEQKEQVVQSVLGIKTYIRQNVRQMLDEVQSRQLRILQEEERLENVNDDQQNERDTRNDEGPSVKRKNYQIYHVMQEGNQSEKAGDRFPKSRSVSFGRAISVGLGSMYLEPGKDLRKTKDRPPTPVTSLETLAAAVSSAPWYPLSPYPPNQRPVASSSDQYVHDRPPLKSWKSDPVAYRGVAALQPSKDDTEMLSEPAELLLDVTLDRMRRKLSEFVSEKLAQGLNQCTKNFFKEITDSDGKDMTLSNVALSLTHAIMSIDAKNILQAPELRFAADAIAYTVAELYRQGIQEREENSDYSIQFGNGENDDEELT